MTRVWCFSVLALLLAVALSPVLARCLTLTRLSVRYAEVDLLAGQSEAGFLRRYKLEQTLGTGGAYSHI